jgi:hypothetical protein
LAALLSNHGATASATTRHDADHPWRAAASGANHFSAAWELRRLDSAMRQPSWHLSRINRYTLPRARSGQSSVDHQGGQHGATSQLTAVGPFCKRREWAREPTPGGWANRHSCEGQLRYQNWESGYPARRAITACAGSGTFSMHRTFLTCNNHGAFCCSGPHVDLNVLGAEGALVISIRSISRRRSRNETWGLAEIVADPTDVYCDSKPQQIRRARYAFATHHVRTSEQRLKWKPLLNR